MPPAETLALAAGAGLVAAVNPCGFALLPAYLAVFVLDDQRARGPAVLRAVKATAAITLGFTAVFAVFGLVVLPVAASVQNVLPVFTVGLGLLLAGAGVWTLTGRALPTPTLPWRRGGTLSASFGAMTGFGVSYAIASLGCTIGPFLAVVITAFRAGALGDGVLLFLGYASGMGLTVGVAAVAVALARTGLINSARRIGGPLARIAGGLLLLAGGYVAWYGIWELRVIISGAGPDPVVTAVSGLQRFLADTATAAGPLGLLVIMVLLLGAAVIIGLVRMRTRGRSTPDQPVDQSV